MLSYKGYGIAIALLLIQTIVCQPLPTPAEEPNTEAYALAKTKFQAFVREYSDKVIQIVREMLKDEKFANSNESDVKGLHNYLMQISKQYDGIEKFDHYLEILYYFVSMPKHYMDLPENKISANTKFIEELLAKYGFTNVAAEVEKEFKLFEETEKNLKNKQ